MMQDLTLALVQMNARLGDPAVNLAKIGDYTAQARARGADLICFPEMALTGYCREEAAVLAQEIPGPLAGEVARLADRYEMVIVAGLPEKGPGGRPWIAQLVAIPHESLQVYRKAHLGLSESGFFTPGDTLPVFNWSKARFAVQICWDLHFPEAAATLALKGCELLLAPHASPAVAGDRKEIWLKYLPARAYDNSLYLAAVNLCGDDGQITYCGGSMVLDPRGRILAENFSGEEVLTIISLKSEPLTKIRRERSASMKNSFFLAQRRPELYWR